MNRHKKILGVAAVCVAAFVPLQVSAQQANDELTLVAGTVDCRYQLRPVDTTICTTPILAAMDLQMLTLFNVLNQLVKPEVGIEMAGAQQAFMKTREACSTDVDCIGQTTAKRIGELDAVLKEIASRGPY